MATGFVSLQPGMPGSRVDLSVSTEEINDLVPPEFLGYVQSGQAFALQTSLATDAENLAIDDLQANLGETSLTASGRMSKNRPMQDASLAIRAQGPDLSAVAPAEVIPYSLPEAPFNIAGGIGMNQHGLTLDRLTAEIGSETLQVSGSVPLADPREGLSLEVAAKGSDLGILIPGEMLPDGVGTYEAVAEIMLKGGILALTGLQVTAEPGAISGELSVSIDDPLEFGEFDLAANGVDLQSLLPANPQYTPPAEPFKLDAMGAWSGELVEVDRGVLELGESRIEAKGEVALRSGQVATGLVISARGDNLKDLGQVEGLIFPEHNFSLDLRLESDASRVHIPDLQAQLGDSELSGRFAYEFGDKPNIEIKLSSPFLDLAPMLEERVKQLEEANNEAAQTEPVPATASGKAIPDVPVPVETLNLANLVAEIDITELRTPRRVIQNLEIDVSLQDGDLQVSRFRAEGVEGDLRARFRTVVEGAGIVTSGEFEGREIVLGAGKATEKGAVFPKQNFRLEFDTAGATSRELVANLNGYAQLTGADGRLSNSYALGLFGSFFGELLSSVNPFVKREPYTSISCFAAYVEIVDGVATINPGAVLQTDKIDVFARGEVNLKSERIKMRFDTTARKGLGVSLGDFVNPFVGVGGTLARPRLGVDPENAMFEGGFAVATGGMSVVVTSLFRSWFGSKDPCADFAAKAEKYHAARLKKLEEQATEKQQQEIPDQEGQTGKIPAKENDRP
jgi:AsmA family protein